MVVGCKKLSHKVDWHSVTKSNFNFNSVWLAGFSSAYFEMYYGIGSIICSSLKILCNTTQWFIC